MGLFTRFFGHRFKISDSDLVSLAKEIEKIQLTFNRKKIIQRRTSNNNQDIKEEYASKVKSEAYLKLLDFCKRVLISSFSAYEVSRSYIKKLRLDVEDKELIEILEIIEDVQSKRDQQWTEFDQTRRPIGENRFEKALRELNLELLSLIELKNRITSSIKRLKRSDSKGIREELLRQELRRRESVKDNEKLREETRRLGKSFNPKSRLESNVTSLFSSRQKLALEKAIEEREERRRKRAA